MSLDEILISRAIIEKYSKKLLESLESEVAVVGGGPAGMTAAYYLARAGVKTVLFERHLSLGGGMWGGGIMFNEIVVQEAGKVILDEFGVRTEKFSGDYFCADSIEAVSTICSATSKAGVHMFNLVSVEDVMLTEGKVTGLVINWSAVGLAKLHVDPITVRAKFILDASGHAAEVAQLLQRKGLTLQTKTGKIIGEQPMWAEVGERMILENTREFFPGVYAVGMCCNTVFGAPRMGPIFGGMLLSGRKAALLIIERLQEKKC